MDHTHNANSPSSDDEWVDAQSSLNNFMNGANSNSVSSSVLLSPSPSSSSTSSVFSPGSTTTSIPPNLNNNGTNVPFELATQAEELTPELIAQGWRKCFSRRENRYYYFNHLTNKSLWHYPQYDQFCDPLGINGTLSDQPLLPQTPTTPIIAPPFGGLHTKVGEKRPLGDVDLNSSATKKPFFVPIAFDIECQTNVVVWERGLFNRLHANPEIEHQRCVLACKLRSQFADICHSRGILEVPKEAFNRWLMERKVVDRGTDELLVSNCFPEMSRVLFYEILHNIPIRLARPKYTVDARKQLTRYAEGAKKMIESNTSVSSESRKIVKWSAEEVFTFIRKTNHATFEEYESRLMHMTKQCQPHLIEAMKTNVERICNKLYHFSCDYAKEIREKEIKYITTELKQDVIHGIGFLKLPNPPKRLFSYPIQLAYKAPTKLPTIQCLMSDKDSFVILRYKQEGVRLRKEYLFKLEQMYRFSTDDKKFELFLARTWCMMKRYQTYWGLTTTLSSRDLPPLASEVSLPFRALECMKKHFQVTFECFASPLNAYFRNYCSVFADTDGYFGSNGNFLTFVPLTGSMAAFPPFSEPLLDVTFDHIDRVLSTSNEPLSFIVFLEMTEYPCTSSKSVDKLSKSKFKRKQFVLQPQTYELRNGVQFLFDPLNCNQKSNGYLLIVFLQNDSGFLKYGLTPDKIELFLDSLKIHEPHPTTTGTSVTTTSAVQSTSSSSDDKLSLSSSAIPHSSSSTSPTHQPSITSSISTNSVITSSAEIA